MKVWFRLWQVNVMREIQGGVERAIRSDRKSDTWTDRLRAAGVGGAGGGVRVSLVTGDVDKTGPSNNTHS